MAPPPIPNENCQPRADAVGSGRPDQAMRPLVRTSADVRASLGPLLPPLHSPPLARAQLLVPRPFSPGTPPYPVSLFPLCSCDLASLPPLVLVAPRGPRPFSVSLAAPPAIAPRAHSRRHGLAG
eukprot:9493291-Pyramimonas_sp.AAC.1